MGIKLMVEIMDHWQDIGLTAGERNDLLVIAENANDASRETFPKVGMHQEYVLRRVGKNAAAWKNAIGKLMKKGALAYAVRNGREITGHPGQVAVYRIPVLCPEAPHDGLWGQCTRAERVTSEVTQPEGTSEVPAAMGHLSGDPNPGMGHLSDAERVTSPVTPSPPIPSGTTPSLRDAPAEPVRSIGPTEGEGGGSAALDDKQQHAYSVLAGITSREPRLALGERELLRLAGEVAIWLERTTPEHLEKALTAGLPFEVGNPAGLVRARLLDKLPPPKRVAAAKNGLPQWCGQCGDGNAAAQFNARFRTLDGTPAGEKCGCHPDAIAA
jgi:hypothetical protein